MLRSACVRPGGKTLGWAVRIKKGTTVRNAQAITVGVGTVLMLIGLARADFNGYETLSDWDALPSARTGTTAGLASSYDRDGGNDDHCHYELPTGFQYGNDVDPTTVTTLTGPGVITRFWMPHVAADEGFNVKMFVDGTLAINTDSDTLLGGNYVYMQSPLVSTIVGGQVSYEPIVFQNSLVIQSNNFGSGNWAKTHHYYQYNYQKLPAGTTVTPYTGTLTAEQQTARDAVVNMINHVGDNPAGSSASAVVLNQAGTSIPAGTALTLANVSGSGRVRRLNVEMAGASDAALDTLRVRVRYDGAAENAVDVPVSHFFGAGHSRVAYKSLPLGTDSANGFYAYWPMPYRQGVAVELYNAGGTAVSIDSAAVEYEAEAVPESAGYLHAVYNESTNAAHEMLVVDGEGHYVGSLLWEQIERVYRTILEGDETIVVDGTTILQGTGLEDAYNGGYYYNHVLEQSDDGDVPDPTSGTGPYSGLLRMNFDDMGDDYIRTDQYRWLIGDPVPFFDNIEVTMQNYAAGEAVFGSTAFYYIVPEPATLTFIACGAFCVLTCRRAGRKKP